MDPRTESDKRVSARRIYVDIDDVLARTIERLIDLLEITHDRRVDVEDVLHFDLGRSFGLREDEIRALMARANSDEVMESIRPVEGAVAALGSWAREGHSVNLVTGRPPTTNAASRRWLARHDIAHDSLHHLDKWGRPTWNEAGLPVLQFGELAEMQFDFAVEDNLDTAVRLIEEYDIPVALMDRPWNRDWSGVPQKTQSGMQRCRGWGEVAEVFARRA